MPTVPDIHRRGTRAAQPAATAVTVGTLYFVTDEGVTERSTGSAWESYSGSGAPALHASSHEAAGSDELDVTMLGGFPGGSTFLRADGTFATPAAPTTTRTITLTIDGAGSAISTGVKGYLRVPVNATITGWTLLADQVGSIVIDVWKDTFANYPPTVADTITASAKPTLSSASSDDDTTLTGWTTAITAGDVLGFNVDSATTVTRVTLELTISV